MGPRGRADHGDRGVAERTAATGTGPDSGTCIGLPAAANPPRSTSKPGPLCLYRRLVPLPREAATFPATCLPCRCACWAVMPQIRPGRVRSGTAAQSPHA
jgi:hypothetical protein